MRAVRLPAPGAELSLEEVPTPEPRGTEVRVRVAGCGVCHTDLHIVDGTQTRVDLPLTLGHEVAGWVDAVGPDATTDLEPGAPVLVFGGWGCGACAQCRGGSEQRCPRSRSPGFQLDGGYAEFLLVPHPRHLVPLGDLDPVAAAPLADAGVTAYRAVRRAEPWLRDGARIALLGAGTVGSFALQYLRLLPAAASSLRVVVQEIDARAARRARELGADEGLVAPDAAGVRAALGGAADAVIDVVGSDDSLARASELVVPGGLVLLVGEAGGHLPFGFDAAPVESWLTTVAWGSRDDLEAVVGLAREARIAWEVEPVPLDEASAAHARLRAGQATARLVLVP
jgi:propanol-preferring alcohol dehydrogenase